MSDRRSLKIGGFVWKVTKSEAIARESNTFGSCDCASQTINLDPNATPQKQEQTLLHEIMHAVFWQTGLSKRLHDDKLEEEIITAASFGLHQALGENKLLVHPFGTTGRRK